MSLLINGTQPDNIKFNGANVEKVKYNGTEVWSKGFNIDFLFDLPIGAFNAPDYFADDNYIYQVIPENKSVGDPVYKKYSKATGQLIETVNAANASSFISSSNLYRSTLMWFDNGINIKRTRTDTLVTKCDTAGNITYQTLNGIIGNNYGNAELYAKRNNDALTIQGLGTSNQKIAKVNYNMDGANDAELFTISENLIGTSFGADENNIYCTGPTTTYVATVNIATQSVQKVNTIIPTGYRYRKGDVINANYGGKVLALFRPDNDLSKVAFGVITPSSGYVDLKAEFTAQGNIGANNEVHAAIYGDLIFIKYWYSGDAANFCKCFKIIP